MTRRTSARIAGVTYLLYIVIGVTQLIIDRAPGGGSISEKLAFIGSHPTSGRTDILLSILVGFVALALAVSLYGITRDEDHEIAVFGLSCRVAEAVVGSFPLTSLGLIWLSTVPADMNPASPATVTAMAAFLLEFGQWKLVVTATLFAVGSTAFCWLLLRGSMIPRGLAWLGLLASVLLVIALPLRLVGIITGTMSQIIWIPMALFEIPAGVWLIVKGVRPLTRERTPLA